MASLFPPSLRFTFGKYNGQFPEAVPSEYLEWAIKNVSHIKKPLKMEIKRILKRRKKQLSQFQPAYRQPPADTVFHSDCDNPPWLEDEYQIEKWPPDGYTGFPTPAWLIRIHPDIPRILCEWKPEDDPT